MWDGKPERAATTCSWSDTDRSAVLLDYGLADGQTQSGAASSIAVGHVSLLVFREDAFLAARGDADPVIDDLNFRAIGAVRNFDLDLAARLGKLDCIG